MPGRRNNQICRLRDQAGTGRSRERPAGRPPRGRRPSPLRERNRTGETTAARGRTTSQRAMETTTRRDSKRRVFIAQIMSTKAVWIQLSIRVVDIASRIFEKFLHLWKARDSREPEPVGPGRSNDEDAQSGALAGPTRIRAVRPGSQSANRASGRRRRRSLDPGATGNWRNRQPRRVEL